jgi:hypothetical protein
MLEDIAFTYGQQAEWTVTLIAFAVITLGAVLSTMFLPTPDGVLSRSYFYLRLGVASVLVTFNQVWWLFYAPALIAGVSWVFMATDMLGYLAYGAYVIRIAVARSRDAYGDAAKAWFILIPIANLFLLFKPSLQPDSQNRSAAAAWIGVVCFVISRVGMGALMTETSARTTADMQADPRAAQAVRALILRYEGPEAGQEAIALAEGAPRRVGPDLTLNAVTRQVLHMRYDFSIQMGDATSLDPAYRRGFVGDICAVYLPYMQMGATVALHFSRPDGAPVEVIDLSLATCTT